MSHVLETLDIETVSFNELLGGANKKNLTLFLKGKKIEIKIKRGSK